MFDYSRVVLDRISTIGSSGPQSARPCPVRYGKILVATLAMFVGAQAGAAEQDARTYSLRPTATIGISGGGDQIASYRGTLFGEPADFEVDAGGDVFLFGGLELFWPRSKAGLLVQTGLFTGGVSNSKQSAEFNRVPLELIGIRQWRRLRGGIGVTHHFSPGFEDEGIENFEVDFHDATGIVLQFEYMIHRFNVGIRHVIIDYEVSGVPDAPTVDGDHWGVTGTYRFGKEL